MDHSDPHGDSPIDSTRPGGRRRPQGQVSAIVVGAAVAVLLYRVLVVGELQHTALLYVGIPTVLALMLIRTPPSRSITGTVLKTITLGLLISAIFLGEGLVCVLMAAPILLGVGLVIGLVLDRTRKTPPRAMMWVLLVAGPASLEGVTPGLSFDDRETVRVEVVVEAPPHSVAAALTRPPDLDRPLPWVLRLGFPQPSATSAWNGAPGGEHAVEFAADGKPAGRMVFRLEERAPGRLSFRPVEDSTPIAAWLRWTGAEVRWREEGDGRTRMTWTVAYRRRLSPAWYFGPLERYGVRSAVRYLIAAGATPGAAAPTG